MCVDGCGCVWISVGLCACMGIDVSGYMSLHIDVVCACQEWECVKQR